MLKQTIFHLKDISKQRNQIYIVSHMYKAWSARKNTGGKIINAVISGQKYANAVWSIMHKAALVIIVE